jgi:hypothetical protein
MVTARTRSFFPGLLPSQVESAVFAPVAAGGTVIGSPV